MKFYGVEMCIQQEHIIYAFKGCFVTTIYSKFIISIDNFANFASFNVMDHQTNPIMQFLEAPNKNKAKSKNDLNSQLKHWPYNHLCRNEGNKKKLKWKRINWTLFCICFTLCIIRIKSIHSSMTKILLLLPYIMRLNCVCSIRYADVTILAVVVVGYFYFYFSVLMYEHYIAVYKAL